MPRAIEAPPMSLRALEAALERELGVAAPSYPTLWRWANSGLLNHAKLRGKAGSRQLYRLQPVLALAQERMQGARPTDTLSRGIGERRGTAAAPCPKVGQIPTSQAEPVGRPTPSSTGSPVPTWDADEIVARIDRIEEQLATILGAIQNLEAVRRMLMQKADAEIALWKQRALGAEQRLEASAHSILDEARAKHSPFSY